MYLSDELDSFDEVREAINQLRNDAVNDFEAIAEELAHLARKKNTKKKKGFAMKRILVAMSIVSLLLFAVVANGQPYVRTDITAEIAGNPEMLAEYLRTVVNSGNTYTFNPISAPSGTNNIDEGMIYYDITANAFYGSLDGSTWTQFDTGTAVSLDGAYNVGSAIDVDTSAVTMTTSDTDNNVVLAIVQNEATNDNAALTIAFGAGATGTGITINSQVGGTDISGDNWSIDQTGLLTAVGVTHTGNVAFGVDGTGVDVTFFGDTASSQALWDQDGDTNGSWILTGASQTITGIDSGGNLLTIAGIDTTGNSDTIVVTHSGSGDALQITAGEADSVATRFIAAASQTTSLSVFDGATSNWDGADNVGMVHITEQVSCKSPKADRPSPRPRVFLRDSLHQARPEQMLRRSRLKLRPPSLLLQSTALRLSPARTIQVLHLCGL
jgi:type II secretory pathway pseudopilin PulG